MVEKKSSQIKVKEERVRPQTVGGKKPQNQNRNRNQPVFKLVKKQR